MPGKTSREAIEAYADPIRQTLHCVTHSLVGFGVGVSPNGRVGTLNFLPDAMAQLNGTQLGLFFSQRYECCQSSVDQLWKVRTLGYFYTVHDCRGAEPCEIFSYQWHPDSKITSPHVHFKKGEPIVARAHLPTGRISIESVVEFLVQDLGVKPAKENWPTIVGRNREIFEKYRSWA